tara:strand:+ start:2730 stop:3128 length:399 start_codon:yes stop_codon:yes gene_type:complete
MNKKVLPSPNEVDAARRASTAATVGGMNQNGHIILLILGGFLVLAIIPVLITSFFWPAKILMQIIMIFILYTTVRGFLGAGTLTLVVSAILIYFMVFKWFELFLALYILQLLLGLQFLSVLIWGIGTTMRKG